MERGAARAATQLGKPVEGICQPTQRDEWGPLPDDIARTLTPCATAGQRVALDATMAMSSALLVIVRDRRAIGDETGIAALLRKARARALPCEVADPTTRPEQLAAWARTLPEPARLLVTGPRGTRWSEGESVALRLVTRFLSELFAMDELVLPTRVR